DALHLKEGAKDIFVGLHAERAQVPRLHFLARARHEVQRRYPSHLLSGGAHLFAHLFARFRIPKTDEVVVGAHKRINDNLLKELIKAKISQVRAALADLEGAYSVADVVNRQTGEVLLEANKPLTADLWQAFSEGGITEVDVFFPERDDIGVVLSRTLDKDSIRSSKEALIEIYRKLRPGDPPTLETATNLFRGMFFDPRKYDFSRVGRLKFNIKMRLDTPLDNRTLDTPDFVAAIKYLFKLRKNIGLVDDIDHLGNRRVRAVGELLENQFRIGLVRMERAIKEKMSV